jgi:hypothetical protein
VRQYVVERLGNGNQSHQLTPHRGVAASVHSLIVRST